MADYRITCGLGSDSGLPEDRLVNVWHVRTGAEAGAGNAATAALLVPPFGNFYDNLRSMFSQDSLTGNVEHKVYALTKGGPGGADDSSVLLFTTSTNFNPEAFGPMPNEVAIALSFAADFAGAAEFAGATRPRSRRRGRVFIGGLTTNPAKQTVNAGGLRPSINGRTTMLAAATSLTSELGLLVGLDAAVSVYSRTDGVLRRVVEYSVDDAYDTIRSRGLERTTRTSVPAVGP